MTQEQIIETIKALTEVIKANNGWSGNELIMIVVNKKIAELIPMIDGEIPNP